MVEICVIHLVRKKNGIAPFEKFLASYLKHPSGIPHDLVLIFKGFQPGEVAEEYDRLLIRVPHKRLFLRDAGFDLTSYFEAIKCLEYRYLCFLNSFSRILADDWLKKLHYWVTMEGVGLVGATGSYQSFTTSHHDRNRRLSTLGAATRLRQRIKHVMSDVNPRLVALRAASWVLGGLGLWDPARYFPAFPNYHIRTNAFIASRETLTQIRVWPMLFKLSAFVFESGHESLTNQIIRLGLRPLVVTQTGEALEKEQWHLSNTFRQAMQENLLVADNQTDAYEQSDVDGRIDLSQQAWGPFARPFQG